MPVTLLIKSSYENRISLYQLKKIVIPKYKHYQSAFAARGQGKTRGAMVFSLNFLWNIPTIREFFFQEKK